MNVTETIISLENIGFNYELAEFFTLNETMDRIILIDELLYQSPEYEKMAKEMKCVYKNSNVKFFSTCGYTTADDPYYTFNFLEYDNNLIITLKDIEEHKNANTRILILTKCDFISCELVHVLRKLIVRNFIVTLKIFSENVEFLWSTLNFTLGEKIILIASYKMEKEKVKKINPKIKYTKELHRMREFSINSELIDDISRRKLRKSEISFVNSLTKYDFRFLCFSPSFC